MIPNVIKLPIVYRYGSVRDFIRYYFFRARYLLGDFRHLKKIHFGKVKRFVFVCKGNVCRSPYGEYKAKSAGLVAVSFGLETKAHLPANSMAIQIALNRSVDMTSHRSTTVNDFEFREGDLIIAMEPWHLLLLRDGVRDAFQTTLLGLWLQTPSPLIADPYGRPLQFFNRCFSMIDEAVANLRARVE